MKVGMGIKIKQKSPAKVGYFWNIVASGIGALLSSRRSRQQAENSLEQTREGNRGALERQNDQQAFEEYLINRRNVAGGPAYGGDAGPVPDFWFGLQDAAEGSGIRDFFSSMNSTRKGPEVPEGAGQIDLSRYSQAGQGNLMAPLDYNRARNETSAGQPRSPINIFQRNRP